MHAWPSFFHLAPPKFPSPIPTPEEHRASMSPAEEAVLTAQSRALYGDLCITMKLHCMEYNTSIAAAINAAQQLVDTLLTKVFEDAADA